MSPFAWAFMTFLLCLFAFIGGLALGRDLLEKATVRRHAHGARARELSIYTGKLESVLEHVETLAADWQCSAHPVELARGQELQEVLNRARIAASREAADDEEDEPS